VTGPPAPAVLLFDWDLTLVDNWAAIRSAFDATLAEYGRPPLPAAESYETISRSPARTFAETFGEHSAAARETFLGFFRERHLEALRPLDGVAELVAFLRRTGLPAGIVSNKMGDMLRREVAHLAWDDVFPAVYGSADAAADKPDPAPVQAALAQLGHVAGPMVWFVGDTGIDLATAHNAGCTAVLVRAEPRGPGEFAATPPHLAVPGCRALLALLEAPEA
jgi:phosphoglycolate phosphatase